MSDEILGKELLKESYFSKKNPWLILAKDAFFVSLFTWLILFWFEWRNPGSVSEYIYFHILLISTIFLGSILLFRKKIVEIVFFGLLFLVSILNLSISIWEEKVLKIGWVGSYIGNPELMNITSLAIIALMIAMYFINKNEPALEEEKDNEENPGQPQSTLDQNSAWHQKIIFWLTDKKNRFAILLALVTLIAFGLRIWNLDYLSPVRDEYKHLNAAKNLLEEGYFDYSRAKSITYMTFFSWKIFNGGEQSVFWARFVSVVLGTLSIPLMYYLVKINANKKIASISAILLALSPFHVIMSHYLREYILFFDLLIIELIFSTIAYKKLEKEKFKKGFIFAILLLILLSYYFIDRNSTYLLNIVIVGFFLGFLVLDFVINNWVLLKNKLLSLTKFQQIFYMTFLVVTFLLIIRRLIWRFIEANIHFKFHPATFSWLKYFLSSNSLLQWFYNSTYPIFFIVLFLLFGMIKGINNILLRASFFVAFVMLVFYIFFFNRYDDARYAFDLIVFFVVFYSFSSYYLIKYFPKNMLQKIIITVFLFSIFNPIYITNSTLNKKLNPIDKAAGLIHRDTNALFEFLKKEGFDNETNILTENGGVFIYYYDYTLSNNAETWLFNKNTKDKDNETGYLNGTSHLREEIKYLDSGWIVIDKDRNRHWEKIFPQENFVINEILVQYLGETRGYRGFDIYKWTK